MRIIHVEDRFEPRAGYQINEMIKLHLENGNEVIIITSDRPIFSQYESLLEQDSILIEKYSNLKIIRLKPLLVISSRYFFNGLFKLIDSLQPDVLYLHGIADFKDLMLLKRRKKYLIFRDCHMSWVASKNKFNKLFAWFFKHTFSIILNNTDQYRVIYSLGVEEKEYLEALGINDQKIGYLPHGYNKEQMYFSLEQRQEIRKELGYTDDTLFISYIGKFDYFKRPDLIFNIFSFIPEQLIKENQIKFLFIGPFDSQYRDFFMDKFNEFQFKDLCILLDKQDYQDLYKFYSAIDVALWPRECTLSSLHAQVCNTIVIMENHKSNIERVYDQSNLFNIGDIEHASEILIKVIKNFEDKNNDYSIQSFLENREYSYQIQHLEDSWKALLGSKQ